MNELKNLVKTTLINLEKKNLHATPENYEKEFYSLIKESKHTIEEQVTFDEIENKLCKKEKIEFKNAKCQSFKEMSKILSKRISQHEVKQFLSDLSYFMTPSISQSIRDQIEKVCKEISTNPNDLMNKQSIRKLRKLTSTRISNDKTIYNDKNEDVKKLIMFLSNFLNKTFSENSLTIEKIVNIKNEIKSLDLSKSSSKHLKDLQDKLTNTIDDFEKTVNENNLALLNTKNESNELYEQIEKLKENLDKAEEEKSIDFLTGVLTRRAFSIELDRVENEFNVFDSNYAIVFYDIDHFKNINDSLGHDCGDSVLATFASILKKLTRTEDFIVRYGGEEFVAIIHYKNKIEVTNYLKRVKNIINNNKFVYKDLKIDVKFSAGVAYRHKYNSYDEALVSADALLYKAKETGRNKIILDDEKIID